MAALTRVLIANRGEIAVRIVRACRESGIVAIVAITPGESGALAEVADGSVEVPSYLDADALVDAAVRTDADAVHPGYGFLAEDAGFAEQVIAAGLVWVGPPPAAMRVLGDKVQARSVAEAAGVPVVPGVVGDVDGGDLAEAAAALGFPVLVKAAAGGGGRGIRRVDLPEDLPAALRAAHDEAEAGFGDGRVFVERRLTDVHHVEIQVLMDEHGTAVHLGERDCSLQRRHQKIVEESPSPVVDAALRARLGDAAIAIAERAGLRGGGNGRVPRRSRGWVVVPGDERPAAGGASGHRGRDGGRHRAGAALDRRRGAALARHDRPARPRDRSSRVRGGPRRAASCRPAAG